LRGTGAGAGDYRHAGQRLCRLAGQQQRGLTDARAGSFSGQETAQLQALSAQMNQELGTLRETQETLKSGVLALHGEIGKVGAPG